SPLGRVHAHGLVVQHKFHRHDGPPSRTLVVPEGADFPGDDNISEYHWVGPTCPFAAKMPTPGIDPSVLRDIPAVKQHVDIRYRDLRVVDASNHEHRCRGFAEKSLGHER